MAMTSASFSATGDPEVLVDINTTPLIDVMLVLLIMLIITIPVQLHAVNLDMPAGHPQPPPVPPQIVQISIGGNGEVRWNGEALANEQALEVRLAAAAALPVQPELHVRPDRQVPYQAVATVMAAVQRKGLTKIGLVGNEQFI